MGVYDRIQIIKDKRKAKALQTDRICIPNTTFIYTRGFGSKTIEKMLNHFETEMNILHKLSFDDLEAVVGEKNARNIINAREGKMKVQEGGGGIYGKNRS